MTLASPHADRFLAAFRARRGYCQALLELSQRQQSLIAADDYADLVSLVAHKQQVLDALLEAGHEPAELWRAWRSERAALPDSLRQECDRTLADTEQLLQHLLSIDQSSIELLSRRRDAAERELCAVNQGDAAQSAYGAPLVAVAPRRLDVNQ
jgi:hypothetical protein